MNSQVPYRPKKHPIKASARLTNKSAGRLGNPYVFWGVTLLATLALNLTLARPVLLRIFRATENTGLLARLIFLAARLLVCGAGLACAGIYNWFHTDIQAVHYLISVMYGMMGTAIGTAVVFSASVLIGPLSVVIVLFLLLKLYQGDL